MKQKSVFLLYWCCCMLIDIRFRHVSGQKAEADIHSTLFNLLTFRWKRWNRFQRLLLKVKVSCCSIIKQNGRHLNTGQNICYLGRLLCFKFVFKWVLNAATVDEANEYINNRKMSKFNHARDLGWVLLIVHWQWFIGRLHVNFTYIASALFAAWRVIPPPISVPVQQQTILVSIAVVWFAFIPVVWRQRDTYAWFTICSSSHIPCPHAFLQLVTACCPVVAVLKFCTTWQLAKLTKGEHTQ